MKGVLRFVKEEYGDAYCIRDSQVNGLPLIRLEHSDEAFLLCIFLNKQEGIINHLEAEEEEFLEILTPIKEVMMENNYDVEDMYDLIVKGIEFNKMGE